MRPRSRRKIISVCLSLIVFLLPAALPSWAGEASTAIDARELRAFVRTYVETQNIRQEYEPPIAKSSDPERTRRLHQNANKELKVALDRNNLTVEQYNRIFARVNQDKPLREKVLKMVEEERRKSRNAQPQGR